MANPPTNIRLDPALKKKILQRAKKEGLSLTEVAKFLFRAYAEGRISIGILEATPEYPPHVVEMILQATAEMQKQRKKEALKGFSSGEELINDMLDG